MSDVFAKKVSDNTIGKSEVHREVLNRMRELLLQDVIFDPVHDFLMTKRVFDDITLDDIREESKNSGKIRALLKHLKKADNKTYKLFKEGLRHTKQAHIVEELEEMEQTVFEELKLEQAKARQPTSDQVCSSGSISSLPQQNQNSSIAQTMPSLLGGGQFNDVHKQS